MNVVFVVVFGVATRKFGTHKKKKTKQKKARSFCVRDRNFENWNKIWCERELGLMLRVERAKGFFGSSVREKFRNGGNIYLEFGLDQYNQK